MRPVTINHVAALAGVSIKTVSRVLNDEPHVRAEKRSRVLDAVKRLNYKPNVSARALAGSRAYLLGLCYDNPSPGYISALQLGAMEACRAAGYHLIVEQIEGEGRVAQRQIEELLSTIRTDGLVLSPPVCDRRAVLDLLDQKAVPYVRIAPAMDIDRSPYVYMDDRSAAYEMTRHLLSLGHRRIGFVKGHQEHSAAPLRYQGYRKAMLDAGLDVDPEWVRPGNFSFRSGVGAAERLLSLTLRPTAIFASNDDMALGVMAVANRMQLNVPKDLSVAGFDDAPIAQVVFPQLTTIRQPTDRLCFEAAALLIQGRGQRQPSAAKLLDFELIKRGSTGRVPTNTDHSPAR